MTSAADDRLVWIDLEMTGLDPTACHILEIATVVTDPRLDVVAEGPVLVIHQDEEAMKTLSDWSREHFTVSGLIDRSLASDVSLAEAQAATLAFVQEHCTKDTAPLCGNSVHTDRTFLWHHMREPARLPALPQRRRLHAQGALPAVVPGSLPAAEEGREPRGEDRHPRVDRRAPLLPRHLPHLKW